MTDDLSQQIDDLKSEIKDLRDELADAKDDARTLERDIAVLEEAIAEPAPPDNIDEIADLIAEAARASNHAKRAYELLRDHYPSEIRQLKFHQRLIDGRMGELV